MNEIETIKSKMNKGEEKREEVEKEREREREKCIRLEQKIVELVNKEEEKEEGEETNKLRAKLKQLAS